MIMKLDEKDRKIIALLSDDPDISQEAIALKVGLSQPSVAVRIKKLKEKGAVVSLFGVDLFKLGLYLAKVDVTTSNTTKILDTFEDCPYFLNGFIVSGEHNLCLIFIGDDVSTLEAIVDFHLRPLKEVQNAIFNIIVDCAKDFIMPVKMYFEKSDKPPCGIDITCGDCSIYGKRCLGCPITGHYRGSLW